MKTDLVSSAIAQAVHALQLEESDLTDQISKLQTRIGSVRTALSSMRPLLATGADEPTNLAQQSLPIAHAMNSYSELPFTKAAYKHMQTVNTPKTIREWADSLVAAGIPANPKTIATQVHVTFKRKEGVLFERAEGSDGKKWVAKAQ